MVIEDGDSRGTRSAGDARGVKERDMAEATLRDRARQGTALADFVRQALRGKRQNSDEAQMRDSRFPTMAQFVASFVPLPLNMTRLAIGIPTFAPAARELPSRVLSSDTSRHAASLCPLHPAHCRASASPQRMNRASMVMARIGRPHATRWPAGRSADAADHGLLPTLRARRRDGQQGALAVQVLPKRHRRRTFRPARVGHGNGLRPPYRDGMTRRTRPRCRRSQLPSRSAGRTW
jgi:hypothetical protein